MSVASFTSPAAVASSLMVPLPRMSPVEESAAPSTVAGLSIRTSSRAHTFPLTFELFPIVNEPVGT